MNKIKNKLNNKGFSHIEIVIAVAVVIAIGGIGYYVINHNHKNTKADNLTSAKTTSKSSTTPQIKSTTTSPVTATSKTTASTTTPTSTKSTSTSSKSTSSTPTSTNSSSSSSSSSPAQAPAATPLSTLTGIVSSLDAGGTANVTASSVTVPGPISNATARPIVFTLNGQTYYAYTQESPPNFNTSASQTASSMAIVTTSSGASLTTGHLDKTGILVDQNEEGVGYSTGGD